ncbi:putative N2,N2-dimethylguanosine tRNA methyltransferase [Haematococcus lacustris]
MTSATDDTPIIPDGYTVLKEGKASILRQRNDAFYNEAQVTNRDLSVLVLRRFLPMLEEECTNGALKKLRRQRTQKQRKGDAAPRGGGQKAQGDEAAAAASAPVAEPAESAAPAETPTQPSTSPAPDQGAKPTNSSYKGAVVLEGLAASGLRSIRYAQEVPGIQRIDANDLDPAVAASMRRNIAFNGPQVAAKVKVMCSDARMAMMQAPLGYDVVDLDPYGTPAQLLDSAVQSVAEGGLLLVTATDMANLCGNNSVACWSNYGSYPLHRPYCHEQALRILLAAIESHANRYKRHIVPLLSLSIDFYIRVFVRIYSSPLAVKESACKLAYVWQSSGCDSFWLQRVGQKKQSGSNIKYMPAHGPTVPEIRCPDSGSAYIMGGPMWVEPLHDPQFVAGLLTDIQADRANYAQHAKIKGYLTSVAEELHDVPLYYDLHDLCKTVRCQPPKSEVFRSALLNAGFRVSGSHANPLALKTDAPCTVVWDIVRCWIKDHPVKIKDPNSYAATILAKQPTLVASFARAQGAVRRDEAPRFVQNPAHWGPKPKHGRQVADKPGNADATPTAAAPAPAAAPAAGVCPTASITGSATGQLPGQASPEPARQSAALQPAPAPATQDTVQQPEVAAAAAAAADTPVPPQASGAVQQSEAGAGVAVAEQPGQPAENACGVQIQGDSAMQEAHTGQPGAVEEQQGVAKKARVE